MSKTGSKKALKPNAATPEAAHRKPDGDPEPAQTIDCKQWPKLIVRMTDRRTYMSHTGRMPRDRCHLLAHSLHDEEVRELGVEGLFAWALKGELGFGSDGRIYLAYTYFPHDFTAGRVRFHGYEIEEETEAGLPWCEFERLLHQQLQRLTQMAARRQAKSRSHAEE